MNLPVMSKFIFEIDCIQIPTQRNPVQAKIVVKVEGFFLSIICLSKQICCFTYDTVSD